MNAYNMAPLVGFYNKKNIGDDLMESSIHNFLFQNGVTSFTGSEKTNYSNYNDIYIGGGIIVNEKHWIFSENNIYGKDLSFINVGLNESSLPILNKINKDSPFIVRDLYSFNLLKKLEFEKIIYTNDIVYEKNKNNDFQHKNNKVLTICPNLYIYKNYIDNIELYNSIRELIKFINWLTTFGWKVNILLSQNSEIESDMNFALLLKTFINNSEIVSYKYIESIKDSNFIISMRYHATQLACAYRIPFIDLTHHSKNINFIQDAKLQDYAMNIYSLSKDYILDKFSKAENSRDKLHDLMYKYDNSINISYKEIKLNGKLWALR